MKNLFKYLYFKKCVVCGLKQDENLCKSCLKKLTFSEYKSNKIINGIPVYSAFFYENEIKKIILNYKFKYKKDLFKPLSELLYKYFLKTDLFLNLNPKNSLLIPIPTHFLKIFKREYFHMLLVTKEFSNLTGIKYNSNILKKKRYTRSQFSVSVKKRVSNIKDSFCLKNFKNIDKTINILILDDIVTTGSTLSKIISLFKNNGFKNIYCLTLSFVK